MALLGYYICYVVTVSIVLGELTNRFLSKADTSSTDKTEDKNEQQ